MVVEKQLKKQIILEIGALIILIASIVYAIFAINNNGNQVLNEDGMVMVLDDASFKALESLSDGEGLISDGIKYTVTNNNDKEVSYKLILKVNEEEAILESLRVGADDLFIDDLLNLAKYEDGYIVGNYTLEPGYTKIHNVKMWYKLDVDHTIAVDTVDYSLELVRE